MITNSSPLWMNHPIYYVNMPEGIHWIFLWFSEFVICSEVVLLGIGLINKFQNYYRNKEYNNRENEVQNFAKYELEAKWTWNAEILRSWRIFHSRKSETPSKFNHMRSENLKNLWSWCRGHLEVAGKEHIVPNTIHNRRRKINLCD